MTGDKPTVILVAPEFAPQNTAAVNRSRFFASFLPRFGWKPVVLTIDRSQIEGPQDEGLEKLLPPDLEVVRTGAVPVKPIRWVGDTGLRTLWHHGQAIDKICRSRKVDALLIPGPPWFSYLLGPRFLKTRGIPYVIDYIDPWTPEGPEKGLRGGKDWFYHRLAAHFEKEVLQKASHVTAVSDGILEMLVKRYPFLSRERMTAMPYGACLEDFEVVGRQNIGPPDFDPADGGMHISFTGAIQPTAREILTAIFRAIARIQALDADIYKRLKVHFYGTSNQPGGDGIYRALPLAKQHGLDRMVTERPERISYLEALAVQRASAFNLVTGSIERYYHASKLYSCLGAGRPLLAICHEESSIVSVLKDLGCSSYVTFKDSLDLGQKTEELSGQIIALCRQAGPAARLDQSKLYPFTAAAATEKLAGVLNQAVGEYAKRN